MDWSEIHCSSHYNSLKQQNRNYLHFEYSIFNIRYEVEDVINKLRIYSIVAYRRVAKQ
jgi:hypothetical protein